MYRRRQNSSDVDLISAPLGWAKIDHGGQFLVAVARQAVPIGTLFVSARWYTLCFPPTNLENLDREIGCWHRAMLAPTDAGTK